MKILEVVLIVVIAILVLVILVAHDRKKRRKDRSTRAVEEGLSQMDARESSFQVHPDASRRCDTDTNDFWVEARARQTDIGERLAELHKPPKPSTVPTFARAFNAGDSTYDERFEVTAGIKDPIVLPANFSAIKEWGGMIIGVYDQERCGSCWSFATTSAFTDRIRIKSGGKYLANGDYLSPFHLAACIKCGKDNACPRVCEGNYLDDVMQYCVDSGAYAQSDIDKHAIKGEEEQYLCIDLESKGVLPWKGSKKYRVNLFPPGQLTNPTNLKINERAIMEEIFKNGSVACIIKVYVPQDKRNFYLYESGIYGYGWKEEPAETDGYHAINILGWGEEDIKNTSGKTETVKYWIVRNSWGDSWGSSGLGRVLRGQNFGMTESDVWAIDVKLP